MRYPDTQILDAAGRRVDYDTAAQVLGITTASLRTRLSVHRRQRGPIAIIELELLRPIRRVASVPVIDDRIDSEATRVINVRLTTIMDLSEKSRYVVQARLREYQRQYPDQPVRLSIFLPMVQRVYREITRLE